jgi:glucose-1-phosphate thymidylyltransferase
MIDHGARIRTAEVAGWYDCGKPGTLIETNRHLLETTRGRTPDDTAGAWESPIRIEQGVTLTEATVGPNVTIEAGTTVRASSLRDCIIGRDVVVQDCELHDSVIGDRAVLRGVSGSVSVAADSVIDAGSR